MPEDGPFEFVSGRRYFDIVRKLGAGGIAVVYLCVMLAGEGLSRPVALKLINDARPAVLVMEYVEGVDLQALTSGRLLPPSIAMHIAAGILGGFGYAHTIKEVFSGIMPGDIPPPSTIRPVAPDLERVVMPARAELLPGTSASGLSTPRTDHQHRAGGGKLR